MRIAYQGVPGAYGQLAARELFPQSSAVAKGDFAAVARAVASGSVDAGILPVENSVIGPITDAVAAIHANPPLVVVAHTDYPVRHCLLALPGSSLARIRSVESHPAALAQCSQFIADHGLVAFEGEDTAGAARRVADDRNYTCAAIASAEAGELYGLRVLAEGIANSVNNWTRFAVIKMQAAQ